MLIFYLGSILIIQVYSKPIHDDTIVHFGRPFDHPVKHHAGKVKAVPLSPHDVHEDSPYQVDVSTTGCRWKKHHRDCSGHYYSRHHHVCNRKLNCGFGMGWNSMHRCRCGSGHHLRVPAILDHERHKCGNLHHACVPGHRVAAHKRHGCAAPHHAKPPVHHAGDLVHHVDDLVHHVVLDGHTDEYTDGHTDGHTDGFLEHDLPAQINRADASIVSAHAGGPPQHTGVVNPHSDADPLLASVLHSEADEAHHGVVSNHPDIATDGTDHFAHVDDEPVHDGIAAASAGVAAANTHVVPVITGIGLTHMAGTLTSEPAHIEEFPSHALVDGHTVTADAHTNAHHGGYTDGALHTSVDTIAAPVLTHIATTSPHGASTLTIHPTHTEVFPDYAVVDDHAGTADAHTNAHHGGYTDGAFYTSADAIAAPVVTHIATTSPHVAGTLTIHPTHTEDFPDYAVVDDHAGTANTHTNVHDGGDAFAVPVVTHAVTIRPVVASVHAESGTHLFPDHPAYDHIHTDGNIPSFTDDSPIIPVHTGVFTEHPLVGIAPTEVLPEELGISNTHTGDGPEHAVIPTHMGAASHKL